LQHLEYGLVDPPAAVAMRGEIPYTNVETVARPAAVRMRPMHSSSQMATSFETASQPGGGEARATRIRNTSGGGGGRIVETASVIGPGVVQNSHARRM
jgi:hypothetical protein